MHQYMTTIITSAIIAALTQVLSPSRWKKYIGIVTGIMIISAIAAPIFDIKKIDFFSNYSYEDSIDTNVQKKQVCSELEKRVSEDAAERLKKELGEKCDVTVSLSVNDNYEICGVKEMTVWIKRNREKAKNILQEVYSPEKIYFR